MTLECLPFVIRSKIVKPPEPTDRVRQFEFSQAGSQIPLAFTYKMDDGFALHFHIQRTSIPARSYIQSQQSRPPEPENPEGGAAA
jgi:hypothetical protein